MKQVEKCVVLPASWEMFDALFKVSSRQRDLLVVQLKIQDIGQELKISFVEPVIVLI